MSTIARVAKNAISLAFGSLLVKFLSLAFFVYIARRLGDVSFGRFSTAMALVGLVEVLPGYLARPYLIRETARAPGQVRRVLAQALWVNVVLSLLVFAALAWAAPHFGYHPDTARAIAVLAFALVFDSLTNTLHAVLIGFERMELSAGLNILNTTATIVFGGATLALGLGLMPLIYSYVAAKALTLAAAWRTLGRLQAQPGVKLDPRLLGHLLRGAWPFFITTLFVMIYARLDIVMLSFFRSETEVGYYNAAYKVMEGMGLMTAGFVQAVYPVLARLFVDRPDRLAAVYRRALRYLVAFVAPAAAGLALLAGDLMPALFGATFGPAAIALSILVWGQALDSVNPLLTQTLRATDRERRAAWITGLGAALNIVANAILIPPFGLYGASVATVLSFGALLWLNVRTLRAAVGAPQIGGALARTAAATALLAAVLWWLTRHAWIDWRAGWRAAAAIGVGCLLYPALALACGVLDAGDRALLRQIVRRRPAPQEGDA
jgi:O-antigen/teichoic acid export membrane protein